MTTNDFPTFSLTETISGLKKYQQDSIIELVQLYGEEEAADKWWHTAAANSTAQFGGSGGSGEPKTYLESIRAEVRSFICGTKYIDERNALLKHGKPIAQNAVICIAITISPALGIATATITPIIAILLSLCGKIGVNAWCEQQTI